jgi:phage baseplate assembly protein W
MISKPGQIASDLRETRFLDYPYSVGTAGMPALTGAPDHLRDLILQILFTIPGERVNLPEFGVGVQRLVFAPNGDALRASTQMLITTGLRRWLGDRIDVTQVTVTSEAGEEETVTIEIVYAIKATQEWQSLQVKV